MRFLKISAMAAMVTVLSATAGAADCKRITALGQMLTHDTAVLFANNALKNTLASQGRVGQGPVTTKCDADGTTCRSSQMACTGAEPKTCLGAWLCF